VHYPFDPENPFPLVQDYDGHYLEAKTHAALADQFFDFQIEEVESSIQSRHPHAWLGLEPQSLLTPYIELRYMLSKLELNEGDVVCDLGAGYGRMGLVLARHYPKVSFVGVESVLERAIEGGRVLAQHAPQSQMIAADILHPDFQIPIASVYFVYDFSSKRADFETLFTRLKMIAKFAPIIVIGRGRATRDQIERGEPWLSEVNPPENYGNFSIYKS
jgi:hypothetical protein